MQKILTARTVLTAAIAAILAGSAMTAASAQTKTTTTTVTTTSGGSKAHKPIVISVNGEDVPFKGPGPMLDARGSSVLVPLRGVFEKIGGQLNWEPKERVITGARPGHQFRIRIGTSDALVNGQNRMLSAPPEIRGGTTYVPLRFASEALGAKVTWQPGAQTVAIETEAPPAGVTTTTTIETTTTPKP